MVYHYYMKIKTLLLTFLFSFPLVALAQVTVVRVKNHQVYLDTSELKTPVKKGDSFKVILSSEKLTNPKTGKELGLVYNYSPEGLITEVQPLYAIGKLPSETGVEIGQEVVLQSAPVTTASQKIEVQKSDAPVVLHKKITYEPVAQEIVSLSSANVTGAGADNIVTLSDKGRITVWKRDGNKLKEETFYQLPADKKPLTISAAPLRGKDTAEIFVSFYDDRLGRINTQILAYEDKVWKTLDTLPYFVKETGCGVEKTVWLQRPFVVGARPGNGRNLAYQDGKFVAAEKSLTTQHNWLTGMNLFPSGPDGEEYLIYTTVNGRVRLELPTGKTTEFKEFSVGAPNRVKYKQELVKFYPALQVVQTQGSTQAAVVENTAKYGLLSSTFGQYESGKIHFLSFAKGRLTPTDTVSLDGFVYDTACSGNAVLTAEVLSDGQSSVVEILK